MRDQKFHLLWAIRVDALQPKESEVKASATEESLQEGTHAAGQRAIPRSEAVVPNSEELFERVFDDFLQIVGRAAGAVLLPCGDRKRWQSSWPPRSRRRCEHEAPGSSAGRCHEGAPRRRLAGSWRIVEATDEGKELLATGCNYVIVDRLAAPLISSPIQGAMHASKTSEWSAQA
jgi:hypothetical protein